MFASFPRHATCVTLPLVPRIWHSKPVDEIGGLTAEYKTTVASSSPVQTASSVPLLSDLFISETLVLALFSCDCWGVSTLALVRGVLQQEIANGDQYHIDRSQNDCRFPRMLPPPTHPFARSSAVVLSVAQSNHHGHCPVGVTAFCSTSKQAAMSGLRSPQAQKGVLHRCREPAESHLLSSGSSRRDTVWRYVPLLQLRMPVADHPEASGNSQIVCEYETRSTNQCD